VTYLNIFYRERGCSVSMMFPNEAAARAELRERGAGHTITGTVAGQLIWGTDYVRAHWEIETSEPF